MSDRTSTAALPDIGKLLRTGKSWRADEAGLRLLDRINFRREHFRHAVIDDLDEERTARVGLNHDVRRLDIAMDDAARFRGDQRARRLFDRFQRLRDRQRSASLHARFERFALHQLHRVKAFAILFAVMDDARDVRMLNLRRGPRFAQETRTSDRILRQLPRDTFSATTEFRTVSRAR